MWRVKINWKNFLVAVVYPTKNIIELKLYETKGSKKATPCIKKNKNLWRRKCVRRARFRISPLQPLLCLQHVQLCHCATCQGLPYTKKEYSLFYQKFDAEYFFIRQFFRKKLYLQRKLQKTVLGAHLTIFLEKRRLTPKINKTFLSQMRY